MDSVSTSNDQNIEVTATELAKWLKNDKDFYILDVRPEEQRKDWLIQESNHHDIYTKLKFGTPDPFKGIDLPAGKPIVTVCAAGKTSLMAAEKLRAEDLEAYSLQGGMKAWNFAWDTAEYSIDADTTIVQVRRLAKGCLSYVVGSGNEAVVIDAALDPDVYMDIANQYGWEIEYVMDTHLHADFVSRTGELAKATGAAHLLYQKADAGFSFTGVKDKQEISFGDAIMKVLHTPGHTPESASYLIDDKAVITGDTLFTESVGRPDLKANEEQAKRKAEQLYSSLQKLLTLDAATKVYPAHTPESVGFDDPVIQSTIGIVSEKVDLLSLSKEEFIEETVSRIPPPPSNYQTISEINKNGNRNGHKLKELEAGANRCAVG